MRNVGCVCAFIGAGVWLLVHGAAVELNAQVASGTIAGTVRDSSGAIVPGASITCKSVQTGLARMVVAGELGTYTIPALPVGT